MPKNAPHSLQAEQAVLGSLMLNNAALSDVADVLEVADFYREDHREIYRAILECDRQHVAFDAVTLSERLQASNKLEGVGGLAYLATITRDTPTAANVRSYTGVVREKAQFRRLQAAVSTASDAVLNPQGTAAQALDAAQSVFMELDFQGTATGPALLVDGFGAWVDELDKRQQSGERIHGITTGFEDLDRLTGGLLGGQLIVLAGRPGEGKTTLAYCIAQNAAIKRIPSIMFSLEMQREELLTRSVSSLTGLDAERLKSAELDGADWQKITDASAKLKGAPLYIDDTGGLSINQIRSRARKMKKRHGIRLIVVDYLQLVSNRSDTREQEIAGISRELKKLGKELNVPVIALSQLNRAVEQRASKRPVLSDLRESGAIEQDADIVAFIYRDEDADGVTELLIAKHRNGRQGTVLLGYQPQFNRFVNLDRTAQEQYRASRREHSAPRRGFQPSALVQ